MSFYSQDLNLSDYPNHFWSHLKEVSNQISQISTEKRSFQEQSDKFQMTMDVPIGEAEPLTHKTIYKTENETNKQVLEVIKKSKKDFEILVQRNIVTQNRNTIKYMMRLFLKYHKNYAIKKKKSERLLEISQTYRKLYRNQQGKINLQIYHSLFYASKFSSLNRKIFYQILGDKKILKHELLENGNVKRKQQYYSICKIMRIRCISGTLCQRTQCH